MLQDSRHLRRPLTYMLKTNDDLPHTSSAEEVYPDTFLKNDQPIKDTQQGSGVSLKRQQHGMVGDGCAQCYASPYDKRRICPTAHYYVRETHRILLWSSLRIFRCCGQALHVEVVRDDSVFIHTRVHEREEAGGGSMPSERIHDNG